MPKEHNNAAPKEVPTGISGNTQRTPTRKLPRWLVIFALVVVFLGLVFIYAPRYVARYLIASELDQLGFAHEGVETLDINPWAGEAWIGPVRIGAGTSDPAKLAELGLDMRLMSLFKRRVSIERLLLRGIDLVVTRNQDDRIALNGISLDQVMMRSTGEGDKEPANPWAGGVDVLELRDSRLIFEDRGRGSAEVVIESLRIMDLRTWEPNRPAHFELVAKVNDIQLNLLGEARPFADEITVSVDTRMQQADLTKLVRFTGPLGLDRHDGNYDTELKHQVSLSNTGHLKGHTTGTIEIMGADYQRSGDFELALEGAEVELDVHFALDPSGDFSMQGQLAADLAKGHASVSEEKTRFGASKGRLAINAFDLDYAKGDRLRFAARPQVDLETVVFSGPVEISVNSLLALLALLQSLSVGGDVTIADTGLGDIADTSLTVPSSDITLGHLHSQAESFSLESDEGQLLMNMQTSTELLDISIEAGESQIKIERLQSALQQFILKSGKGKLSLNLDSSNSLTQGTGVNPIGDLRIGALKAETDALNLEVQTGAVSGNLVASIRAEDASSRINALNELPEARFQLGTASAVLSQSAIDALDGVVRWQLGGDATLDAMNADYAQGEDGDLSLANAQIKGFQANEKSQVAADILNFEGLELYLKRSLLQALFDIGEEPTDQEQPAGTGLATPTTSPTPSAKVQQLDLRRIQTLLSELGYNPGPLDGLMGRRTAAAIKAFQDREGMVASGRPSAALLAALENRAAGTATSVAAPAGQVESAQSTGASLRLGQLVMSGNPVIRFRDDIVTPNVNLDAVFKQAQINNLDTRKTKQRTELSISGDINEFTRAELRGWINGLSENADFDLNAKVENLSLATYSPYIEALAQAYVESGRLDTTVAGTATQGALQGEIQLALDKLRFRPLSAEDAEQMTKQLGVPLDTVVKLLQDSEGRIELKLPVSGTVSEPDVDISSAVDKAVGGALRSVFPPVMVTSLMSSLLQGEGASFESIGFAPGSAELDGAARGYADKLAEFLTEHPKLSVNICGRSTAQDLGKIAAPADTPEPAAANAQSKAKPAEQRTTEAPLAGSAQAAQLLDELAIERKRAVRRYLVNEKGLAADRIGECGSSFEAGDQGNPRVEVFL